jgi:hypothetical protein
MKRNQVVFLRIAEMDDYRGTKSSDIPRGAGSYVDENGTGGEVRNFLPIKGKFYGYARIQKNGQIHIERLGADKKADKIDNITIVFFSRNHKYGGGQYIVGWYKNATLYRSVQQLPIKFGHKHKVYNSEVKISNAKLIHKDERTFQIPKDGPGQYNVWYVEEFGNKKYLKDVLAYIKSPSTYYRKHTNKGRSGRAWQKDIEIRKKVENAAMNAVAEHFAARKFNVTYVHRENLGWDLEASNGRAKLLLEVKGLSGPFESIELTHNEFEKAQRYHKNYRLCIVSHALTSSKKKLLVFYQKNKIWQTSENYQLSIQKLVSARLRNSK